MSGIQAQELIRQQVNTIVNTGISVLTLIVAFYCMKHLVRSSVIDMLIAIVVGAIVWMLLRTNLLVDMGDTIVGWLV